MTNAELEQLVKKLEKKFRELEKNSSSPLGKRLNIFEPECLHNGCSHNKNPVCMLYCPHCSPMC